MAKYIDADLLKKDIERLNNLNKQIAKEQGSTDFIKGITAGYAEVLSSIDSLQQEQQNVDLEKFTEKMNAWKARYNHPDNISIKATMAFTARMFYMYPNVAREWYDSLPKEHKTDMDEIEKQLLFKDLCARLPYGVKINIKSDYTKVMDDTKLSLYHLDGFEYNVKYRSLRPYLRPMSSMTEEEGSKLGELITIYDIVDWMLAHHFDVHNLIEKGLALEAQKDMYKTE